VKIYIFIDRYQHFRGNSWTHLQDRTEPTNSFTLKTDARGPSQNVAHACKTTRRHISEESNLRSHLENFKWQCPIRSVTVLQANSSLDRLRNVTGISINYKWILVYRLIPPLRRRNQSHVRRTSVSIAKKFFSG